ncbi:MAG: hypothetical protein ABI706_04920 [Ilumatobacteraceae bacterium]
MLPAQKIGRPRIFCSHACRQWDWVGRQRAHELQLNETELIITKSELDQLHDELYVLACAVDDVERDLASVGKAAAKGEFKEMLTWLLEAARPIRNRELPQQRP